MKVGDPVIHKITGRKGTIRTRDGSFLHVDFGNPYVTYLCHITTLEADDSLDRADSRGHKA